MPTTMIRPRARRRTALCALFPLAVAAAPAAAQESINVPAPTQPGEGRFTIAERMRYLRLGDDPTDQNRNRIDQFEFITNFQYGLTGDIALSFDLPVVVRDIGYEDRGGRTLEGVGDMTALVKWRAWQHDFGPVDTMRLGLSAGLRIGSGHSGVSDSDVDPIVGAAFMLITGRHGFNIAADWTFTTGGEDDPVMPGDGEADLLRAGAAWLYRIIPDEYTADTNASWYTVLELTANYETNGDHEMFLAPGLLYEARRWAAEISLLIPVSENLDKRPETSIGVVAGVRFLF